MHHSQVLSDEELREWDEKVSKDNQEQKPKEQ
jgi:hypothetical protein